MKVSALPVFGDAYLADTRHLTLEEHGAYFNLLLIAWRSPGCALPADDKRIARMLGIGPAKWAKLRPVVMAFWTLKNGLWTQKRLTKERKYIDEKVETNRASANKRWNKQPIENKEGEECDRICEGNAPHTSHSSVTNVTGVPPVDPVKMIFDQGVALLTADGTVSAAARSLIGRWRKESGDGLVFEAITEARLRAVSEPKAWITAWLAQRKAPSAGLYASIDRKYGT